MPSKILSPVYFTVPKKDTGSKARLFLDPNIPWNVYDSLTFTFNSTDANLTASVITPSAGAVSFEYSAQYGNASEQMYIPYLTIDVASSTPSVGYRNLVSVTCSDPDLDFQFLYEEPAGYSAATMALESVIGTAESQKEMLVHALNVANADHFTGGGIEPLTVDDVIILGITRQIPTALNEYRDCLVEVQCTRPNVIGTVNISYRSLDLTAYMNDLDTTFNVLIDMHQQMLRPEQLEMNRAQFVSMLGRCYESGLPFAESDISLAGSWLESENGIFNINRLYNTRYPFYTTEDSLVIKGSGFIHIKPLMHALPSMEPLLASMSFANPTQGTPRVRLVIESGSKHPITEEYTVSLAKLSLLTSDDQVIDISPANNVTELVKLLDNDPLSRVLLHTEPAVEYTDGMGNEKSTQAVAIYEFELTDPLLRPGKLEITTSNHTHAYPMRFKLQCCTETPAGFSWYDVLEKDLSVEGIGAWGGNIKRTFTLTYPYISN